VTSDPAPLRVDIHCHMGQIAKPCQEHDRFSFEPAGKPLSLDAYLSPRMNNSIGMRAAKWFFGLPRGLPPRETDAAMETTLLRHILNARLLDRAVVLAFDQYHTTDGQAVGARPNRSAIGTDLYLSNTYARSLWQRYPRRILFGASIHPYRRLGTMTAADMLAEVAAAGAVLVKWLPQTQNIDAQDPRTVAFLRQAAKLEIPLLVHFGPEYTLGHHHKQFADPAGMLQTLRQLRDDGDMPTVIIAHVATPSMWPIALATRPHRILIEALAGEFASAPLYADIAALAMFSKARWLKRTLRIPGVRAKLVHGSDFPIPSTPLFFRSALGKEYHRVRQMPSWLDRDVAIKSAAGVGEDVFRRGGELLASRIKAADALASIV